MQTDVQNAIKRESLLHAAEIGVTVHDRVVALTVSVDSYTKKLEAENDKIKIKVENGSMNLEGLLHWNYQKNGAKDVIKNLEGIVGVTNSITIKSETADAMEKEVIEHHLQRSWALNANDIKVAVNGTNVKLNDTVGSLYQKKKLSE